MSKIHKIRRFLWLLYQAGVVLSVGWFALLMAVFATDSPQSSVWMAGLFGLVIFSVGYGVLVVLPAKLFRFFHRRAKF